MDPPETTGAGRLQVDPSIRAALSAAAQPHLENQPSSLLRAMFCLRNILGRLRLVQGFEEDWPESDGCLPEHAYRGFNAAFDYAEG